MGRGLRAAPPSPPSRPLPGSHTSPSTLCTSQPREVPVPAQELLRRRGGSESLKRGFVSLCAWSGGDGQEPWGVLAGRRRRPKCLLVPCGGFLEWKKFVLGRAGAGGELPDFARFGRWRWGCSAGHPCARASGEELLYVFYIFTAGCSVRWQVLPLLQVGGVNALPCVSLVVPGFCLR